MPNCFQLFRKGETEPTYFYLLDEELCAHLGKPVHKTKYVCGWFDAIGFLIATGKSLGSEELRECVAEYESPELTSILAYLEERFTSDAWAEIGRR